MTRLLKSTSTDDTVRVYCASQNLGNTIEPEGQLFYHKFKTSKSHFYSY